MVIDVFKGVPSIKFWGPQVNFRAGFKVNGQRFETFGEDIYVLHYYFQQRNILVDEFEQSFYI